MQPNWQQQQGYGFNPSFTGGGGMQQPQQTGQQGMGMNQQQPSFMNSQPTGFQQQRTGGNMSFLNAPPLPGSFGSQQTGGGGGSGFGLNAQQTGYGGGGFGGRGGGGMTPQMTGYPAGGASGMMPQQTGFQGGMMPQQTGYGGGGLMAQPTGFGLRAQPTGYQDPRLASMMQSFMPSNTSQPFGASGAPQFNSTPQNQPLSHTFQSLIQNPKVKTPKVPWVLSKQEKKDYDQIFRAWEKGDGFVSGETAREVFGQSGLSQDDLIKIWTLSDVSNRGKLNLAEFHVAMGLVYRALNGNEIPDTLPEEMVPPSMRDIDTTVNFMRDLLKHEASTRSNTSSPAYGSSTPLGNQSKDATAYKHDDTRPGSTYKPSSRHLDRKSVRYAGEESGADIGDIRRQLQNTSAMLDKSNADYERKTEEDERLEQEVEDLKYRVKRLQDDIDYVSKGRRTAEKDEERRKLERELLFLMHEKLPELERRQQQREEERKMEERAGIRARDRRNDSHGRFDDRDDRDRDDHSWLKGTYDRDRRGSRDRDRDSYRRDDRDRDYDRRDDRDRDYRDRDRDRDYRPRSPPASRTPPPAPPAVSTASAPAPPPPAPPKTAQSVPNTKNMTPEERTAFIREQAQKRIQDRLRALGVEPAAAEPAPVDKSVEERLAQEKKEAEEKSRSADEEQKAREQARQARLAGGAASATPETAKKEPPKSPEPKSILKGKTGPPPPPASRGKQPPVPPMPRVASAAPPAPIAPPAPKVEEEDPEEAEFRQREEAIKKAKEERRRRLAELEKEEEEERKREEEMASARKAKTPVPEAPAAPPAPPAPQAPPAASATGSGGYNPFRKPAGGAAASPAAPPASSPGGFNPFFKPQSAKTSTASTPVTSPPTAPPAPPMPVPPPAPAAPPAPLAPAAQVQQRSVPASAGDDGWESIHEKEADSDDSSDDEDYANSRNNRRNLASALFGGITGGSSSPATSRPGSAAPKANPATLQKLGGGDPNAGRGALLSAIAGGARLKKTQTVVKGETVSGKVIGDAAPPAHISDVPREHPEVAGQNFDDEFTPRNDHRQSVDWYAGLASDQSHPAQSFDSGLDTTREEIEPAQLSSISNSTAEANGYEKIDAPETQAEGGDELADFDLTTSIRVRTLYPYEGQRDVDLTFRENVIIIAHPAKDSSSPWWYGIVIDGGQKGWFPHNYVQEVQDIKARALYSYAGSTPEELPFAEGDELVIVDDKEDATWWKTEKAGVVFLVPSSYLEVIGEGSLNTLSSPSPSAAVQAGEEAAAKSEDVQQAESRYPDISSLPDPTNSAATPPNRELLSYVDAGNVNPLSPGLLSPGLSGQTGQTHTPTRPRSSTMASYTSSVGDVEESSSEDSVLSWWSEDESDDESDNETAAKQLGDADASAADETNAAANEEKGQSKEEKERERKRREEERMSILNAAGLKIRRDPPDIPSSASRTRRRAPPAPGRKKTGKTRRSAPAVPKAKHDKDQHREVQAEEEVPKVEERPIETQDAYARYEQFLAESRTQARSPITPQQAQRPLSTTSTIDSNTPVSPNTPSSASIKVDRDNITGGTGGGGGGRLSGLLSRIMAPSTTGTERKGPSISGPISRVDESNNTSVGGGSGMNTPTNAGFPGTLTGGTSAMGSAAGGGDMGKTWGSLVDPDVLGSISDRERKRQEAIYEFITTESSYNRDLQLIVQSFYAGLLDHLDEKAQQVIFANIEDILLFNTAFLSDLEERQRESRLWVDKVGDVVGAHMVNMDVYMTYCVNQSQAGQLLQSLRSADPALQARLENIKSTNPAVRGLDLSHFLLIPMQRITRYPLLLKQIINYTDPDQDLIFLQEALHTVERIVSRINEKVRENESHERLRVLSEDLWIGGEGRLDLTADTAYQGPRKLLKEGSVTKTKSGRKLTLVLCNDILVLIDSRNLYRMPIPLFELTVRKGRDESAFVLKVEYRRGSDTISLKAPSSREAKEWRYLIEDSRLKSIDARMISGTGGLRGF